MNIDHLYKAFFSQISSDSNVVKIFGSEMMNEGVLKWVDEILNLSKKTTDIQFYKNEKAETENGMFLNNINLNDYSNIIFDDYNYDKQLFTLKNCILKTIKDKTNCFFFNDRILLNLEKNIVDEVGFYLRFINCNWEYGYKNENGFACLLKPIKMTKGVILNNLILDYKDMNKIVKHYNNLKNLFKCISPLLTKRYDIVSFKFNEETENELNNSVGDLLEKIEEIGKNFNEGNGLIKSFNSKLESWFSEININEVLKSKYKDNCKYRKFTEYVSLLRFMYLSPGKYKNHEKIIDKSYDLLISIFSKYFYVLDLKSYNSNVVTSAFNPNKINLKDNIKNFDKEVDKNLKNIIFKNLNKYFNNFINVDKVKTNYEYFIFIPKYGSHNIGYLKKESNGFIFNESDRQIKTISLFHFALNTDIENVKNTKNINKSDILEISYLDRGYIDFLFKTNNFSGEKNISCFSLSNEGSKFTYSYENVLRQYCFYFNNKNIEDSNNIKDDKNNESIESTKNILSILYNYSFNSFYEKDEYNFYKYTFNKNKFSSIYSLLNNGNYIYVDLNYCNNLKNLPLITLKRGKMLAYGRLNKDMFSEFNDKTDFGREIISMIRYNLYPYYSIKKIFSKYHLLRIEYNDDYFFTNDKNKEYLVYHKIGSDYVGIIDKNSDYVFEFNVDTIRGDKLKFNLIYNVKNNSFRIPNIKNLTSDFNYNELSFKDLLSKFKINQIEDMANEVFGFHKSVYLKCFADVLTERKDENFEGISGEVFYFLLSELKKKHITNNSQSSLKEISEIKLDNEISYNSFISFVKKNSKIGVDEILKVITNNSEGLRFEQKRSIKFVKSLLSRQGSITITDKDLLNNLRSYSIIKNGSFSCDLSYQDYYNLVLLCTGYIPRKNEYLIGNLEGICHLNSNGTNRIYFTFDNKNNTVDVLNFIGHLKNINETSKKKK